MSGLTLLSAEPLFTTPLFTYQVPDHDVLNTALYSECLDLMSRDQGTTRSNQKGYHSKDNIFVSDNPSMKLLCSHIISCLTDVLAKTTTDKDEVAKAKLLMSGWVNVSYKNSFNVPHDHPGNLWSGSYYVKSPKVEGTRSGVIEFLDPRNGVGMIEGLKSSRFTTKHRVSPKEGTVLIFPSFLRHWVYPNDQDDIRISIAFNCKITG